MAAEQFDTSWMWNPAFIEKATSTAGRFVHFRKTFVVNSEISTLLPTQITADRRYKLYINKQFVAFGPVKGDASLWFYDEVDISPYLRLGENHIAIHVLRLFHGTSYGTSFPRLGTGGVKIAATVDDEVWAPQVRSSELWQTAIDHSVTLRVEEAEDDFLHNSTGVTAPWKLSPRLIPPMRGQRSYFSAIHNVQSGLSRETWSAGLLGVQSGHSNILLSAGSSHQLDLETPVHTTAFIRFRFVRPEAGGACLTIKYSESYEDTPVLVPYLRCKGNRCDTSKFLIGPKDIYAFQGKDGNPRLGYYDEEDTEEVYMPFHWRTFRFMRLNIETGSSDLIMRGIDIDVVNYPLDVLSKISTTSDDGTLGALSFLTSPGSLYWICMLHDHFLYYAYKAFVRPPLPVVDAVLGYFHELIDQRLDLVSLGNEKGVWNFHDWAEQWRPYGIPPSAEESGVSTYTNSLYTYTLKLAAKLQGECAGRLFLAEEYCNRTGLIVDAVKRQCFDGQYFTDSIAACSDPQVDRSQHNQVWAVLSGATELSSNSAQALLNRALGSSQSGTPLIKTSISTSFYTFHAISAAGGSLYDELFHVLWQPWRHQLSLGLTTWEEDDVSHRSDCHAWGSAPIYEFLAEVAGIRPAKAGWQEIEFAPRLGLYTSLEATVPFYREGKMVLAKVSWSSLDGETRVTLGFEGLDESISVHVNLPGWPGMVEKSSQNMSFTWTRS
ncbi:six-hairpin glycosidase [Fusarium subglutinans]|uniref:Six-hairpin glycosidase n=1 Tax=Gibberella subglutinans TaxID=42677 RepID=A0A8H5PVA8_GIBSU|nr:six-hairpin glycosidase [Fusarium subglutinans]KAF5603810.1 six-hairpin glycosidase [Fusarium subglutinans]